MGIENALMDAGKTLVFTPHNVLRDIMGAAPAFHDLDTGKIIEITEPGALIMGPLEARMAMDYYQGFPMGFAGDGISNTIPIPLTEYETVPSFGERHPILRKFVKPIAVTLAILLAGVSIAGCVDNDGRTKIIEKRYDFGRDHAFGTPDDHLLLKMEDPDGTDKYWYSIGREGGYNASQINKQLDVGDTMKFENYKGASTDGSLGSPYPISKIINYKVQEKPKTETLKTETPKIDTTQQKQNATSVNKTTATQTHDISLIDVGIVLFSSITIGCGIEMVRRYLSKGKERKQARRNKNKRLVI